MTIHHTSSPTSVAELTSADKHQHQHIEHQEQEQSQGQDQSQGQEQEQGQDQGQEQGQSQEQEQEPGQGQGQEQEGPQQQRDGLQPHDEQGLQKQTQSQQDQEQHQNQAGFVKHAHPPHQPIKRRRKSSITPPFASSSQNYNKISEYYNRIYHNYYHSKHVLSPNPRYVNIKTSVNHWQLRDLLKYCPNENQICFTKNDTIQYYDFDTMTTGEKTVNFDYYPRCFDISGEYTATGGLLTSTSSKTMNLTNVLESSTLQQQQQQLLQQHQLQLASPMIRRNIAKGLFSLCRGDQTHTIKIGEQINNDVKINPVSNQNLQIHLSNNDSHLYCMDVSNSQFTITNKINCEQNTCLNASAKNPRSNLITVVGDSSSIFLVDPLLKSPVTKTIKGDHDGGFSVSYHPDGNIFSTVFQDGICQLYDLRNLSSPLHEFESTRMGHQSGAFRVCKISQTSGLNCGSELMVIAEHVGRVHLVDLKTMERQVIVVPAALDQFATHQLNGTSGVREMEIYGEQGTMLQQPQGFNSPLVYEYEYLVNKKIFKDFSYDSMNESLGDVLNMLRRNSQPLNPLQTPPHYQQHSQRHQLPLQQQEYHRQQQQQQQQQMRQVYDEIDLDQQLNEIYRTYTPHSTAINHSGSNSSTNSVSSSIYHSGWCEDSYQQLTNHVHGEMELSGVDFIPGATYGGSGSGAEMRIAIACQDAGMVLWDVNSMLRRSIGGSFEFV